MQIVPINSEYLREHEVLLREFQNATLWPKHLLVHYLWKEMNPVNVNAGLYLVFTIGMPLTRKCPTLPYWSNLLELFTEVQKSLVLIQAILVFLLPFLPHPIDVFAGILSTCVLGVSAMISYEKKLKEFLADLNAEGASALQAAPSSSSFAMDSQKAD